MIVGGVLLGLAALVVVAGASCWFAGVQLIALVKVVLGILAVCFTLAGAAVVSGELLTSAGYFDTQRGTPNQANPVTPIAGETSISTQEMQLRWMHEQTVGVFIEGQGFGMWRMRPDLTDIITQPKSQATSRDVAWGGTLSIHQAGKGVVHNAGQIPASIGWTVGLRTDDNANVWKVRTIQLLGLVTHPEPVVYLTDKMPAMKDAKEVPTRAPDAFEETALAKIEAGGAFVTEQHDKTLRVVGPIFAGKGCVKCHEQKGQLLGAFSYQLERVPMQKPDAAQANR